MASKLKPVTVRLTPEQLTMLDYWWESTLATARHTEKPSHAKILKELIRKQIRGFGL